MDKNIEHIERYTPNIKDGLSSEQIARRIQQNLTNVQSTGKTKSIGTIILENFLTLFNIINLVLALALLWAGSYKNMMFIVVVGFNLIIGIIQEIRAKLVADRLSLISAIKTIAIRDGAEVQIPIESIVLDDVLKLSVGDQVASDCIILNGLCEVDESFVTGESNAIEKRQGASLLSGSYIVSGSVYAQVEKIADHTYISGISKEAKKLSGNHSETMRSINKIIKVVSIAIFPIGAILLYSQYKVIGDIKESVVQATAGLIGMIPEGLVLLTSMVFAVSVIRLSKHNILVQELSSVESLARVDTICLDKTGTLTTGDMCVEKIISTSKSFDKHTINNILYSIVTDQGSINATSRAIKDCLNGYSCDTYITLDSIPFSSTRKWSANRFNIGTCILGAFEYICPEHRLRSKVESYTDNYRVLTLAYSKHTICDGSIPIDTTPIALILLKDTLRPNAKETIDYFKRQQVNVKIISGDSVKTVSTVARNIGIEDIRTLDTSKLSDNELTNLVNDYSIFCRVTPERKRLIVRSLKDAGHVVAMTGDGVNDVPALKESDCSIAVSSGAETTRNISQLVLLDSDFASLPNVVAEGRRSINNLKRSASLFLIKTIYSILLDVMFIFIALEYPFIPIQLTLISAVCIGIPSFVLALEPNRKRVEGSFLTYVLNKAVPTALDIVLTVTAISLLGYSKFGLSNEEVSTICVISTGFIGLLHLFRLCKPFTKIRIILMIFLIVIFMCGLTVFSGLFSIVIISNTGVILLIEAMGISVILFVLYH